MAIATLTSASNAKVVLHTDPEDRTESTAATDIQGRNGTQ